MASRSKKVSDLTTSLAKLTVDGRKEILELIDTDQEIVDTFLGRYSNSFKGYECPILTSKISTLLGGGKQGAAYIFDLGENGNREYVIKITPNSLYTLTVKTTASSKRIDQLDTIIRKTHRIPDYVFFGINGGKDVVVPEGGTYYSVKPNRKRAYTCILQKDVVVEKYFIVHSKGVFSREYTGDTFLYPKGSYICDSATHTEYIISLLCMDILRREVCINFLDIFGFAMCGQSSGLKDYTFMQRIHGDINQFTDDENLSSSFLDSILIQSLFAISAYRREHSIQHNDLHAGNVFVECLSKTKGDVIFRGQDVKKATHFEYSIDGKKLYVKNHNYIVKIGDFGYSVAFGKKIIAPTFVSTNTSKATGENYPSWKMDSYDLLLIAADFCSGFGNRCPMACRLLAYILDPEVNLTKGEEWNEVYDMMYISKDEHTPLFHEWYARELRPNFRDYPLDVWDLLKNPKIVDKEITTRPKGKIVVLGEL